MRRIEGSAHIAPPFTRPVVTVGNFDGIHVGHRAILDIVVERARAQRGDAVVFTFDPHPRRFLQPESGPGLITTLEQKLELLEEAGVDAVVVEPFTAEFARTSPESFIRDVLHGRIGPMEVYVGYDFHFGRDRAGSMRMLTEIGPKLGFSVTIISEVTVGGQDVNSTRVRELLARARPEEVAAFLGRPYAVRGTVVEGDRRGRTLGFPTANLAPDEASQVLPVAGVYAGRLRFLDDGSPARGEALPSVANVGTRPTFGDAERMLIESHLLDFEGDVYGRRVEFVFEHHLRPERKFENVERLRGQISADVAEGRLRLEAS